MEKRIISANQINLLLIIFLGPSVRPLRLDGPMLSLVKLTERGQEALSFLHRE